MPRERGPEVPVPDSHPASNVSRYSLSELMSGSSAFGVGPEVVFAAMRVAKLTEASREEAQVVIDHFLAQEIH